MTDKNLLYWVFKLYEDWLGTSPDFTLLDKDDFDRVKAPDWVYPAYKAALEDFRKEESRDKK